MKGRIIFASLLMVMLTPSCERHNTESKVTSNHGLSIQLLSRSATFDIAEVPQGAVHFTALIKNAGATTMTIAHPMLCVPADYHQEEIESHGKSEILLEITTPNGAEIILRDRSVFFEPCASAADDLPFITIPPNGTGAFDVGWFFRNARGKWEHDVEAANVFLVKGRYKIRILIHNVFPKAMFYDDNARSGGVPKTVGIGVVLWERVLTDVWIGEMESPEITIEVK
ncbi:MAG TPA: hypothetical protein VIU12_25310 [Chryseolinea sp.]